MSKRWMAIAAAGMVVILALVATALWRRASVQVSVTLTDYRIEASHTWVRKGELVTLTVTNRGHQVHELEVEGYERELEDVQPGASRKLTFRAERSGPVELVCRLPGHYEQGMRTTIHVVD